MKRSEWAGGRLPPWSEEQKYYQRDNNENSTDKKQ